MPDVGVQGDRRDCAGRTIPGVTLPFPGDLVALGDFCAALSSVMHGQIVDVNIGPAFGPLRAEIVSRCRASGGGRGEVMDTCRTGNSPPQIRPARKAGATDTISGRFHGVSDHLPEKREPLGRGEVDDLVLGSRGLPHCAAGQLSISAAYGKYMHPQDQRMSPTRARGAVRCARWRAP